MDTATQNPPAVKAADGINPELHERTALQIYLHKINGTRRGFDPHVIAAESFLEAKAFCEIAQEVRLFGDEALAKKLPIDDGLDDASAPNLPPDHPFNLRSRRFGNAETLARYRRMEADAQASGEGAKRFAAALRNTGSSLN